jgi:hypothetical protein
MGPHRLDRRLGTIASGPRRRAPAAGAGADHPDWRICTRAGFSGALSLFHLVPLIGSFIVMACWPSATGRRRSPPGEALTMGRARRPAACSALSALRLVGTRARRLDGLAHRREGGPAGLGGLGAILLTLTGVGSIVPLSCCGCSPSCAGRATRRRARRGASPGRPARRRACRRRRQALADRRPGG